MNTRIIQDMTYDQTQGAWVAQRALPDQPAYRRAGKVAAFFRSLWGAVKMIGISALSMYAVVYFWEEMTPWYSRIWSAITGSFPLPF